MDDRDEWRTAIAVLLSLQLFLPPFVRSEVAYSITYSNGVIRFERIWKA